VTELGGADIGLDSTTILAATPALHGRLVSFLND